jgi:hypothetical protein
MATMFKKTMQNKFDKLKTDEARIKFIMKELEKDGFGDAIWEDNDNKYMLGTIWNPVRFDKKLFNKIKPKLERQQERETGGVQYFWILKGKWDYA